MFSGIRALIRKVFCKKPSRGYTRIDGEKPFDTHTWKDEEVSEKTDLVLEKDPSQVSTLQPGHKGCIRTAPIRRLIDMYFRINHEKLLRVEQVIEHMGQNYDHLFESLRRDTDHFNSLNPDSSRRGSMFEVSGLNYSDHGRFAGLMQSVDPSRKMGSFNLYLKISCLLNDEKYAEQCRAKPHTVELLRLAAMRYDMEQATQHAGRGGAALIHVHPELARLDLLQQWENLFRIARESPTRLEVCSTTSPKLSPSEGYEIDSAMLVEWYSKEILHPGTAKA